MKKILPMMKKVFSGTLNDTILSLTSKAIGMLFFLATDVVVARFLPKSDYGEWSFYYATVSMLFWLVWLGINESVRVYVARERECAKNQNSNILVGLKLRIAISVVFLVVFSTAYVMTGLDMPLFLKYPHLKALFLSGCFLCFFNSFSEFFKSLFIGLVKFNNIFVLTIVEFGGNFLFGVLFLLISESVIGLGWGYVMAACMSSAVGGILLRKHIKEHGFARQNREYEQQIAKKIFKYAMPIFVLSMGALLLTEMDVVMLGILSNSEETATYSIAKSLTGKITHVNLAICTSTMTVFAVITKETLAQAKMKFRKIMIENILLVILVCICIWTIAPIVIRFLYGKEYNEVGQIMVLLIPYYCGYAITIFLAALLDYQGRANKRVPSYFVMVALNLIFNYLLIPQHGAKGAAIATSISIIPYLFGLIFAVCKMFRQMENEKSAV